MRKIIRRYVPQYLVGFLAGILVLVQTAGPLALAEEDVVSPVPDEQSKQTESQPENSMSSPDTSTTPADPETSPETTPTETPADSPTPTAPPEEETGSSEQAVTGDEQDPTPTPTPEPSQLVATSSAEITNEATTSANTGNNEISSSEESNPQTGNDQGSQNSSDSASATPPPTPDASVETGNAISVTQQENEVNSTEVNAQAVYHSINIYIDGEGEIDLSMPRDLAEKLVAMHPTDEFITALASASQTATVSSELTSMANTGGNETGGYANARISTGDAITLLSLLNRINFVLIDSVVHVVNINIFGNFLGNILLPDLPDAADCDTCGSVTVNQDATVATTVDASADTGNNAVTGTGEITTGSAYANVRIVNIVNTILYGSRIAQLYILNYGEWNGSFLGWADAAGQSIDELMVSPVECLTCQTDMTLANSANVQTNIQARANTGGNSIDGGNGSITTGNAISAVSVINMVNSAFIRSFGFFGFINIFGKWTGDIGSKSLFPTPTPQATAQETATGSEEAQSASNTRQPGGLLDVTVAHNVGQYVLPGDTVTFFVNIKNPGSGPIYDATLDLRLTKGSSDRGGLRIELGTIEPGKKKKVTTGIVLSQKTAGGEYLGVATVTAAVGPDDKKLDASAQTAFQVWGFAGQEDLGESIIESVPQQETEVLGATTKPAPIQWNILFALLVHLALLPQYALYRLLKDKELGSVIFMPTAPALARLRALHLFLL